MTFWLQRNLPRLVVAPSFAVILWFIYGFVLWTIYISFTKSKLLPKYEFWGLQQHFRLWSNSRWHLAVENLLVFTILFLVLGIFIGILLGIFMSSFFFDISMPLSMSILSLIFSIMSSAARAPSVAEAERAMAIVAAAIIIPLSVNSCCHSPFLNRHGSV